LHLDIIKVFYLPTDAQEDYIKRNIKIYIKNVPTHLIPYSDTDIHQPGPHNICSHTTKL